MPNRELLKQLELEKQRRGMNRTAGGAVQGPLSAYSANGEGRYAWEYELEAYRAQQKKMKWMMVGALCGVFSIVLEMIFHWTDVVTVFSHIYTK